MILHMLKSQRIAKHSYHNLKRTLEGFSPISLSEMVDVSLLNRVDTKYLIPLSALNGILQHIQPLYRVLEIEQIRLNKYHTVYYDEPDFTFYNQHHNRHSDRYKARARRYLDTNVSFFEVKHKTNKKRTIKSRLPLQDDAHDQNNAVSAFADHHLPHNVSGQLEPKLWNDYLRFTLVSQTRVERVTIDVDLSFGWDNTRVNLPGMAIAEVKQEHFSHNSDFIQLMRHMGIRQVSFSKYCAGVYLLYDNVKTNNFKPVMRHVQQLVQQEMSHASRY